MRDTSCLKEFYKRFCRDLQHWRFIDLYDFAISSPLGYMVLDFVSNVAKYRINSLNIFFDTQANRFKYIIPKDKEVLKELNGKLRGKFEKTLMKIKHQDIRASTKYQDSDDQDSDE